MTSPRNKPATPSFGQEVATALRESKPLSASRFRHAWLVRGLHPEVHRAGCSASTCQRLAIAYNDGSLGAPFPLRCRPAPPPVDSKVRRTRIGLNSGRHPGLDAHVDFYLLRSKEVDTLESYAEQEEEAFIRGRAVLTDDTWASGGVLDIFQTGLEPLVLGFYRAVVEVSLERAAQRMPPLWIVPKVFRPADWFFRGDEAERRRKQVNKLVRTYPDFFAKVEQPEGGFKLRWRPERPMFSEEHDTLVARFEHLRFVLDRLEKQSRFDVLEPWG